MTIYAQSGTFDADQEPIRARSTSGPLRRGVEAAWGWLARVVAAGAAQAGCASCDTAVAPHHVFCAVCATTVVAAQPACLLLRNRGVDLRLQAATSHGGAIAEAVNRLKHRDRPDLARPLGHLLRAQLRGGPPLDVDAVVPVPLHRVRLAERQYNQAALLARAVATELEVPVRHGLVRLRPTPPQQGLTRASRARNVEDAFAARGALRGQRLLLVDDVCTTGATLGACATALLAGGAAEVSALVVARRELAKNTDSHSGGA